MNKEEQLENKAKQEELDPEEFGEEQTLHFISHSHWDREWYLPFEKMRRKLVLLFDQVLEEMVKKNHFSEIKDYKKILSWWVLKWFCLLLIWCF